MKVMKCFARCHYVFLTKIMNKREGVRTSLGQEPRDRLFCDVKDSAATPMPRSKGGGIYVTIIAAIATFS